MAEKHRPRTLLTAASLCAAVLASAQGGQGGAFGAAGGQGGRGGQGDITEATHILSPGDTATWPIKAKAGEVVIARVTSRIFDPAVEVVDSNGKVLAENDDIRPGEQDAVTLARMPEAGDYKIQVKAYKGGSGGQYSISLVRFVPEDAKISARNSGTAGRDSFKWLRFPAVKGQTLTFSAMSSSGGLAVELYNPMGLPQETMGMGMGGGQGVREAFRAEHTGDHYLRLGAVTGFSYSATISPARVGQTAVGATETRRLDVGGLDIFTFEAKEGDLLRIKGLAKGASVDTMIAMPPVEGEDAETMASEEPMVTVTSASKSISDDTVLIRRSGKFEVRVFQPLSLASDYELSIQPVTATVEGETRGKLVVGVTDLYAFEGKAGEVIDLSVMAEDFDATLALLDPNGRMIATNDDGGGGSDGRVVQALTESGRYLVGVSSYGRGGGGSYRLTKAAAKVRTLAKGVKGDSTLGSGTADIWSLSGKAGQTIIVSAQSEEMDVEVHLLAPDGTLVAMGRDDVGTNALASLVLPLDGTYTIWVRGSGSGKYTVRWLDLND